MTLSPETLFPSYSASLGRSAGQTSEWFVPLVLLAVDAAVIEGTFLLGWAARSIATPLFGNSPNHLTYTQGAVFLLILLPAFAVARLYPGYGMSPVEQLRRRLGAIVIVLFGLLVFDRVFASTAGLSRVMLFLVLIGLLILSPLANICVRATLAQTGRWGTPTLIIGTDRNGRTVASYLQRNVEAGLRPIGFIGDDMAAGSLCNGLPVFGSISDAGTKPDLSGFRGVVVLSGQLPSNATNDLLSKLPFRRVILIPNIDSIPGQRVRLAQLGGMLGFDLRRENHGREIRLLKRLSDLCIAVPLLVCMAPLLFFITVAIRLDSPGPALFRQERYGLNGKVFVLYKFRTMRTDAAERLAHLLATQPDIRAEYERYHKIRNDPRITRLGRFLRKTSLDELPQLWNAVRGDMSLVGPRPYMPTELDLQDEQDRAIVSVKPGISGLWQVSARNKVSFEERKEMDAWYTMHRSIWLDFHLLLLTAHAVIRPRHAS
ncbi:MAG TPA: undecaprenyl-phosphate galactose phosphotransferase WbaP [Arenibaculum sp.]|nr:undecaprenyl-phosphate galactose phosphotransferase WbaP [Arenibaculum sp.]